MIAQPFLAALAAPPSVETAAFNAELEARLAELPATHEVPPDVTRAARAAGKGVFPVGGPLDDAAWRPAPTPPGRVRVTTPRGAAGAAPRGVFLHVHGGGWTLGAPEFCDVANAALAEATGWTVVSAPYRLAPEHPWPACADDVEAAALWLAQEAGPVFGTERLAIGGESAGAHLAMVALLRLRDRGAARDGAVGGPGGAFRGAVLNYGAFDLSMTPSMRAWGARKLVLSTPTVAWFVDNLAVADPASPDVSPLRAALAGLPPALLQVGTADPLVDDTTFMAARLAAAGVPVDLRIHPGGVHAFDAFDLAIARDARAAAAGFLNAIA